jgi:C-terminal processing protease CtpA/Prc
MRKAPSFISLFALSVGCACFAADSAYSDGVAKYEMHAYAAAEKLLRKAISEDHATDPLAHYYLASTLAQLKRYGEAADEYDAAVKCNAPPSIRRYCTERSQSLRTSVYPEGVGGIGVKLGRDGQVLSIFPGSPAARAGVRKGDVLWSVDGLPKFQISDLFGAVRGKPGTTVVVQFVRDHDVLAKMTLVREIVDTSKKASAN